MKCILAHQSVVEGLIAATAIHHGLTVVTRNTRDFAPTGASLLDPWRAWAGGSRSHPAGWVVHLDIHLDRCGYPDVAGEVGSWPAAEIPLVVSESFKSACLPDDLVSERVAGLWQRIRRRSGTECAEGWS